MLVGLSGYANASSPSRVCHRCWVVAGSSSARLFVCRVLAQLLWDQRPSLGMHRRPFTMVHHANQRRELLDAACRMNAVGLNQGTSGNVSVRIPGGLLITPSSLAYELMCLEDLVAIDLHGQPLTEAVVSDRVPRKPSSEWRLHADIFATRPDVQAVLHCHSIHATAIACHGRAIPPFHYMTAVAGGDDIRCAAYATFGTEELSRLAVQALQDRLACLLAQHGQVALGAHGGLQQALRIAVEVETLARMYLQALQLGEPPLLSAAQMQAVHHQFRSLHYGEVPAADSPAG